MALPFSKNISKLYSILCFLHLPFSKVTIVNIIFRGNAPMMKKLELHLLVVLNLLKIKFGHAQIKMTKTENILLQSLTWNI